ncbi:MAG: serine hydrolase [Clostridia bacterium]|nr:serine hydrolase [Clostridia bacterium]
MSFEFNRISPEEAGVSSYQILEFLNKLEEEGTEMHSMMLLKGDSIFAEGWWKPYNPDTEHILFSFTKTLTSTAIGFAVNEGVISLDDKLVDIFPDKLPEVISDNLKKADVRSLLTMSCGHSNEIEAFGLPFDDFVKAFLAHPFEHEPNTYFMYNTAGTNMLCAILLRKTGEKLTDYLKPRLFDKLGMGDVYVANLPNGVPCGGAGGFLKTEQMARFIRFIANRGTWNGERLLSQSWFDLATTYQIDNTPTQKDPDWTKGYGFQFWCCVPDGVFRADGAFGQYGIVVPDKDMVFIFQSASTTMQDTLTVCWNHLLKYVSDKPLPEDKEAYSALKYKLENLEINHPITKKNPQAKDLYDGLQLILNEPVKKDLSEFIGGSGMLFAENRRRTKDIKTISSLTVRFGEKEIDLITDFGEVLPISMNSHFNSFELNGHVYGAVGTWASSDTLEFLVYCASAASGTRYRLNFGEKPYLTSESSLAVGGPLGGGDPTTITFTKGENHDRTSDFTYYFGS